MRLSHYIVAPLIGHVSLEALPGPALGLVYRHAKRCRACSAAYDDRVRAERAAFGDPSPEEPLSHAQVERIARTLGLGVAQATARPARRTRTGFLLGGMIAATATAAVVLLLRLPAGAPEESREWRARGLLREPAEIARVDAYCVASGADSRSMRRLRPRSAWSLRPPDPFCKTTDELAFALRAGAAAPAYAFVLGVDRDLHPYWYYPVPHEQRSVQVKRGADELLPGAIELSRNHHRGPLYVFALYSEKPVQLRDVAALLAEARRQGTSVEALELDLPGVSSVQRLDLELE